MKSIDDATPADWHRALSGAAQPEERQLSTANSRQVAGDHYASKAVQPGDYIIAIYPVKIEAVDDAGEALFHVETFDEHCATITLHQITHSNASLQELCDGLREAFKMLALE